MIYTLSDLEAQFSPERLALGRRLFTKGLATAPNVQRGGELVTTVIRQSRNRALRVYVRAIRSGKRTVIAGECSCRKRHNCEHVAAVLLQALADRDHLPAEIPGGAGGGSALRGGRRLYQSARGGGRAVAARSRRRRRGALAARLAPPAPPLRRVRGGDGHGRRRIETRLPGVRRGAFPAFRSRGHCPRYP